MGQVHQESPLARAYALFFGYRVNAISYGRARRELVALGVPELAAKGRCPVDDILHSHSLETLRRNLRLHVPPARPATIEVSRALRVAHLA